MSSATAPASRSVTFDTMLDWFRHQGGRLSASLQWQGHEPRLVAQRDMAAWERVLVVPRSAILSSAVVRHSVVGARLIAGGIDADRSLFAAWLAHERRVHGPWQALLDASTQDFSYIPMLYPRSEHHWLQGTAVAHDAMADWNTVREQFRRVNDLLPRGERVTLRDFAWGWHLYITQVFSLGTEKDKKAKGLVPLGGLLPHGTDYNCNFTVNDTQFEFYVVKDVPAGTPLTIGFGRMHATHFFGRYGHFPDHELSEAAPLSIDLGPRHWLHALAPELTQSKPTPRFWLTNHTASDDAKSLRSLLRLLTASSRAEARQLMHRASGSIFVPFIDLRRERSAMERLAQACRETLTAYTTTRAQDESSLESAGLPSWQRQCVRLRRSEKVILEKYLRLAERALDLLDGDTSFAVPPHDAGFLRDIRNALPRTATDTNVVAFPAVHAGLDPQERRLSNWFFDQGGTLTGAAVRVNDGLRGMVAIRDIEQGEVIMRVPRHLYLTDDWAKQSEVGRTMTQKLAGAPVDGYAYLAMTIADTRRRGGHWSPMVDALPGSYSRPECFDKEAWSLLVGTEAGRRARSYWQRLRHNFRKTQAALPSSLQVSLRTFLWAHQTICTRSFNLKIEGEWVAGLIPVAEMFNHARDATCHWGGDNTRHFDITMNRHVAAGAPLTISYGISNNTRLLAQYGFCPDVNEDETVRLYVDLGGSHWLHQFAPKLTQGAATPGFELGLNPARDDARKLFSVLRLMQFDNAEAVKQSGLQLDAQETVPIVGLANEISVLERVVRACEQLLEHFPGAAVDDAQMLADPGLDGPSRMAITYRIGQRNMAHTVKQLAAHALQALRAGQSERSALLAKDVRWDAYHTDLRKI